MAVQELVHRFQRLVASGGHHGQVQIGKLLGEGLRRGEVGLGQAQDGPKAPGVGGDQGPVHQSGARRRVGQCHHHHHLVGVGDHHPFGRVGVVGGAAQHAAAGTAAHDPGQGVGPPGQIADHVHLVTDDDRGAAQFAGPHGGHPAVRIAQDTSPPAPIHRHDHGRFGVGVLGSGLGARTGAAASGADVHIGLVVLACDQTDPSSAAHSAGNSGRVLAVVAMFST